MQHNRRRQGFTLVELMIVIVIISVLSLLAITGFRKYTYTARKAEANEFLGGVRVAQETYFQAFGQYCGSLDEDIWPDADKPPFTHKYDWGEPPADSSWGMLGMRSPGQVWFLYVNQAGPAGNVAGNAPILNRDRPWFWARAEGDFNGDGNRITFEVSSERPNVYELDSED